MARLNTTCGHRAVRIDHIGSTAVPGLDAKDVIDVQVTVASLEVADELTEDLLARRLSAGRGDHRRRAKPDARSTDASSTTSDTTLWHKRFHASADPGRPTNVHIRVDGWPNQQFALLFVDWLTANPGVQADYLAVKRPRPSTRRRATTPRPRSRGSSTPTAAPGHGPTPRGWRP